MVKPCLERPFVPGMRAADALLMPTPDQYQRISRRSCRRLNRGLHRSLSHPSQATPHRHTPPHNLRRHPNQRRHPNLRRHITSAATRTCAVMKPLRLALRYTASDALVQALLAAHPEGAKEKDDYGSSHMPITASLGVREHGDVLVCPASLDFESCTDTIEHVVKILTKRPPERAIALLLTAKTTSGPSPMPRSPEALLNWEKALAALQNTSQLIVALVSG